MTCLCLDYKFDKSQHIPFLSNICTESTAESAQILNLIYLTVSKLFFLLQELRSLLLLDTVIIFYQKDSHSTFYWHFGVFLEEY